MKVFIGLLAVFVVLSCGSTKDPIIKIKTGQKANKAKAGSQLQLSVKSSLENFKVKFFLNDQPISSNHQFSDTDQLGEYKIKAVLTQKDKSFERTTIFTLLASKAPKLFTYEQIKKYFLNQNKIKFIPNNLIDEIKEKKIRKELPFFSLKDQIVGENRKTKINKIVNYLKKNKADNLFITAPENIAWILNIRGYDNPNSPIPNCRMLLTNRKKIYFFAEQEKVKKIIKSEK